MQYFQHHAQYFDVTHFSLKKILLLSAIYMPLKANLKDSFTEFRSVIFVFIDCLSAHKANNTHFNSLLFKVSKVDST